jgi:hypothetical protein
MKYLPMLDAIWDNYEFQKNSLKLVQETAKYNAKYSESIISKLQINAGLADIPLEMIRRNVVSARRSLEEYVILSVWVVFERLLIEFFQNLIATDTSITANTTIQQMVVEQVRTDVERWKPDMMLDLIKSIITADTAGTLKQIKRHRDWVAHRNPAATPEKIDPRTAYELVREAARQIEQTQPITP